MQLLSCYGHADSKWSRGVSAYGRSVPWGRANEEGKTWVDDAGCSMQSSSAAVCQAEAACPSTDVTLQMQVDFNAKNDYDMINNYKVLQDVFNKLGVEKVGLCSSKHSATVPFLTAAWVAGNYLSMHNQH
jgi:hypothetical protein